MSVVVVVVGWCGYLWFLVGGCDGLVGFCSGWSYSTRDVVSLLWVVAVHWWVVLFGGSE